MAGPLEGREHVLGQAIVEVGAAQKRVTVGRQDLEGVVVDLEDRRIEGAAAQIIYQHHLLHAAAVTIGNGGGRWLVEDALHVQASQSSGFAHRHALCFAEVGRHGDHGAAHAAAQSLLGHVA